MLHKAWNSKGEMPYCFPRSSIKFQGHTVQNITDFDPNWAFPDCRPVAAFKSLRFALLFCVLFHQWDKTFSSWDLPLWKRMGYLSCIIENHDCRWTSYARSQGISSHGIDIVILDIHVFLFQPDNQQHKVYLPFLLFCNIEVTQDLKSWITRTGLSYKVNTIAADGLATQEARALATMSLT